MEPLLTAPANDQYGLMHDATPDRVQTSRRGILIVFAAISLSVVAAILAQPRVSHWLKARAAYGDLSHPDQNERTEAIRWLVGNGENPDEELIGLLGHSDEGVRISAASALAFRRPVTDRSICVFLDGLEADAFPEGITRLAPNLFHRHAEQATGPITSSERRMIAWLQRRLDSEQQRGNSEGEGRALAAFLPRDPTLMTPLRAYLKVADLRTQISVIGQIAKSDSGFREEYLQLLLTGVSQDENRHTRSDSLYLLRELHRESADLVAQLETRLDVTSNPEEAAVLDRTIDLLKRAEDPAR